MRYVYALDIVAPSAETVVGDDGVNVFLFYDSFDLTMFFNGLANPFWKAFYNSPCHVASFAV